MKRNIKKKHHCKRESENIQLTMFFSGYQSDLLPSQLYAINIIISLWYVILCREANVVAIEC